MKNVGEFTYLDSSALVKLVHEEKESTALREFVGRTWMVSSAIARTEVPRALRGIAGNHTDRLLERGAEVLGRCSFVPVDEDLLDTAGALDHPGLRSLDAIHLVSAASVSRDEPFISYDRRQYAAAVEFGLYAVAPR